MHAGFLIVVGNLFCLFVQIYEMIQILCAAQTLLVNLLFWVVFVQMHSTEVLWLVLVFLLTFLSSRHHKRTSFPSTNSPVWRSTQLNPYSFQENSWENPSAGRIFHSDLSQLTSREWPAVYRITENHLLLWMYVAHVTSLTVNSMTQGGRCSWTQPFLNESHSRLIYELIWGCLVAWGLKGGFREREHGCCRVLSHSPR